MITETNTFHCPRCVSTNVVKNGKNRFGSQQFLCKDCHKSAVMHPRYEHPEAEKEQILAAYHERPSMRGVACTFHISRDTLKKMLKKKVREQPSVSESVLPAEADDVLKLDEGMVICVRKNC